MSFGVWIVDLIVHQSFDRLSFQSGILRAHLSHKPYIVSPFEAESLRKSAVDTSHKRLAKIYPCF